MVKSCKICLQNKPIDEYYVSKYNNKDGSIGRSIYSKCKICHQKYAFDRKDIILPYKRKWSKDNSHRKKSEEYKIKTREYQNRKYRDNIQYKISRCLRSRLHKAIKKDSKFGSAVDDLDCSVKWFTNIYIPSLWINGMSWNNYGKKPGQWSLDHVIPLSAFDLTDRG